MYKVDDRVYFNLDSESEGTGDGIHGTGSILGCSSKGLINFYIILLDEPIFGHDDKAIVVQDSLIKLLKRRPIVEL